MMQINISTFRHLKVYSLLKIAEWSLHLLQAELWDMALANEKMREIYAI